MPTSSSALCAAVPRTHPTTVSTFVLGCGVVNVTGPAVRPSSMTVVPAAGTVTSVTVSMSVSVDRPLASVLKMATATE